MTTFTSDGYTVQCECGDHVNLEGSWNSIGAFILTHDEMCRDN